MRKTKSMGNLAHESRLQKAKSFVFDRLRSKKKGDSANVPVVQNTMKGSYPALPVNLETLVILAPFIPVFVYAVFQLFSSVVLFLYTTGIFLYFLTLAAYFVTEIAIRPPWYANNKPEQGLPNEPEHVPTYWQGVAHDPAYDLGLDFENVEFKNEHTGHILRGWFIPTKISSRKRDVGLIFVHGAGRDRRAWLRHQTMFHIQGYSTLLFDMSEHGVSDGARRGTNFGFREQYDVVAAVKFMKEQKGFKRIVLVGTSVGGASVILASYRCEAVDIVVAENPVACANDFALFHLKRMVGAYAPPWAQYLLQPFYTLITLIFLYRIGGLLKERPVDIVGKLKQPLLLMHGTSDDLVPVDHSLRLKKLSKGTTQLWLAKDAWHCALYDHYPSEFQETVCTFLDKHLLDAAEEVETETDVFVSSSREAAAEWAESEVEQSNVSGKAAD